MIESAMRARCVEPRRSLRPDVADRRGLADTLRPWRRRLLAAELAHAGTRWACAAALTTTAIVVGLALIDAPADVVPLAGLATGLLVGAIGLAIQIGGSHLRAAHAIASIDARLGLADRLTTAWALRDLAGPVPDAQRRDAVRALDRLRGLHRPIAAWPSRERDLVACALSLLVALGAVAWVHPRGAVLEAQQTNAAAVQAATERLGIVSQNVAALSPALSPETAARVQAIVEQARADLGNAHTRREAQAILARADEQLNTALADPAALARDDALAAMSEALASDSLARPLAQALQHEDPVATHAAFEVLAQNAQNLSQPQRQSLSQALQRAADVGRGDATAAAALSQAAQAVRSADANGQSTQTQHDAGPTASSAFGQADAALLETIQAARAQATLHAAAQSLSGDDASSTPPRNGPPSASTARSALADAPEPPGRGAGVMPGLALDTTAPPQTAPAEPQAGSPVFTAGRVSGPATDSAPLRETFSVRGQPREYRDALPQYTRTQRDYVDRSDVAPADRDLVQRYFGEPNGGD